MKSIIKIISISVLLSVGVPAMSLTVSGGNNDNTRNARQAKPSVVLLGPSTTYLQVGLSTDDVVRLLGDPESITSKDKGGILVTTYVFKRSGGRFLVADFEDDVLIDSHMQPGGRLADKGSEARPS